MKPPFKCSYDEGSDVLYITGSDNRPAIADDNMLSGFLFRYAIDNGDPVGITILSPTKYRKDKEDART